MTLRIDLRWPVGADPAIHDVADIRMSIRDQVLTRLFDGDENRGRDYFRASAIHLGFWFADNWWRLRWEPIGDLHYVSPDWRLRHELSSASGDTIMPPFMIYGVGPRVIIAPIVGERVAWGPIHYLHDRPLVVSGDEFEQGIDSLFDAVLAGAGMHPNADALRSLIGQLRAERADNEQAAWRRLEACLGFDPDQAPDEVIDAMVEYESLIGEEGIEEAAVASPGEHSAETVKAVLDAVEASQIEVDFTDIDNATHHLALIGQTPWQAAEDAAQHLHDALNLPAHVDWMDLGDMLRIRWHELRHANATAFQLPYAGKAQRTGHRSRFALAMNPPTYRRFEIARMMGDRLWTRGQGFGVISRSKTDRQKFQRAFAQALLCPMGTLRGIVDLDQPAPEQITQAAGYFDVEESVIVAILVNRGYLPRETAADWLDAA